MKDFRKDLIYNESLSNNPDKQIRKAIKQSNRNNYQNFNQLKLRFSRLFIPAVEMKISNSYREFERKRDLHNKFILVHSHKSYI